MPIPGDLEVSPNPVIEGQTVQVTYKGTGSLYISVDGSDWVEIPIDGKTGKGQVTAPVGGGVMVISNNRGAASTEAIVEIVQLESP